MSLGSSRTVCGRVAGSQSASTGGTSLLPGFAGDAGALARGLKNFQSRSIPRTTRAWGIQRDSRDCEGPSPCAAPVIALAEGTRFDNTRPEADRALTSRKSLRDNDIPFPFDGSIQAWLLGWQREFRVGGRSVAKPGRAVHCRNCFCGVPSAAACDVSIRCSR
jgi:hypothetical protein